MCSAAGWPRANASALRRAAPIVLREHDGVHEAEDARDHRARRQQGSWRVRCRRQPRRRHRLGDGSGAGRPGGGAPAVVAGCDPRSQSPHPRRAHPRSLAAPRRTDAARCPKPSTPAATSAARIGDADGLPPACTLMTTHEVADRRRPFGASELTPASRHVAVGDRLHRTCARAAATRLRSIVSTRGSSTLSRRCRAVDVHGRR